MVWLLDWCNCRDRRSWLAYFRKPYLMLNVNFTIYSFNRSPGVHALPCFLSLTREVHHIDMLVSLLVLLLKLPLQFANTHIRIGLWRCPKNVFSFIMKRFLFALVDEFLLFALVFLSLSLSRYRIALRVMLYHVLGVTFKVLVVIRSSGHLIRHFDLAVVHAYLGDWADVL